MSVIDDRTPNLNLPLVNENNELQDDVYRLRELATAVDGLIFALQNDAGRFKGPEVSNLAVVIESGFYSLTAGAAGGPAGYTVVAGDGLIHIKKVAGALNSDTQLVLSKAGRIWVRHKTNATWGAYIEVWTDTSLVKQSSASDVTAGRMMAVGAFGIGSGSINAGATSCDNLPLGSFHFYESTEASAATLKFPALGGAGSTARHWHVISQGTGTLRSQIATEVKGSGTTKGRMFTRVFDTAWTSWVEVVSQTSMQAQIDSLALQISEVRSLALAGI